MKATARRHAATSRLMLTFIEVFMMLSRKNPGAGVLTR